MICFGGVGFAVGVQVGRLGFGSRVVLNSSIKRRGGATGIDR